MCANLSNLIFQVITAIGSLATFGAFIFLFRRDKDKQVQIDKLAGIASVLESQNETIRKQNELIAQQVDIFRNTSILKGNDEGAMKELKALEEKKLKLSVRPNLWLNGAGINSYKNQLHIDLNNKGEDAVILELRIDSKDIILVDLSLPYNLEKGQSRYIFARPTASKNLNSCTYEIEIVYTDKLDNKYSSKIRGTGANVKIIETKEIN